LGKFIPKITNFGDFCGCKPTFLSASLYVSKRGAYLDRLCRDVVGCHARALWPNGAS